MMGKELFIIKKATTYSPAFYHGTNRTIVRWASHWRLKAIGNWVLMIGRHKKSLTLSNEAFVIKKGNDLLSRVLP